jgi:hypothetical protein
MCVWHNGDMPRSTNVVRSGAEQKRQQKLRIEVVVSITKIARDVGHPDAFESSKDSGMMAQDLDETCFPMPPMCGVSRRACGELHASSST